MEIQTITIKSLNSKLLKNHPRIYYRKYYYYKLKLLILKKMKIIKTLNAPTLKGTKFTIKKINKEIDLDIEIKQLIKDIEDETEKRIFEKIRNEK